MMMVILFITGFAQENGMANETATGLRANDKIWVVMVICLTILAGLLLYLISLDKKLSKFENK